MPFSPNQTLTLCSDFGTADGYAAAMKGSALSVAPELRILDLSHDIPPWDIRRASFALWTAVPLFPPGTVHVVVVDPGVGTDRAALIAVAGDQVIVAPDNGVISLLYRRYPELQAYQVETPQAVSATFHGRDVFAPVGAQIAAGSLRVPGSLPVLEEPVAFPCGYAVDATAIQGSIICADRFGNLITTIDWSAIQEPATVAVSVDGFVIETLIRTFGEKPPGSLCFLEGSSGLLEISCVQGSALEALNTTAGAAVRVLRKP